ncbi:hypothetical protein [Sphingosinicella microcystinivorans]|uniref:hypothetical protein n=1 Tax=Sphingosinicella microcystinivorans TaxID=335406 RepID=UPI0022F3F475|nr:hypothetical protein [Sphingosinicella microcystinivorans]WBX83927.1 hypothetical protein PE061_19420 [Sphingosinicella microcystinivorans]
MSSDPAETHGKYRRRLSLGEMIAILALVVSALTLLNNYIGRKDAETERLERVSAPVPKHEIGLIAVSGGGSGLEFKAADCALQGTEIRFPSALGVEPQSTVLEHRIETAWFEKPLLKAIGKDVREGRVPVAISSRCVGADGTRVETAIYDVAYRIEPRVVLGRTVKLRGMLRREAVRGDGLAELDRLWKPQTLVQ